MVVTIGVQYSMHMHTEKNGSCETATKYYYSFSYTACHPGSQVLELYIYKWGFRKEIVSPVFAKDATALNAESFGRNKFLNILLMSIGSVSRRGSMASAE